MSTLAYVVTECRLEGGGTDLPFFNDDQTLTFFTRADADGHHPDGESIVVSVQSDGTGLKVAPPVVALPGGEVLTSFRITDSEVDAAVLLVPGTPVNPDLNNNGGFIQEVFTVDADDNVVQLTNFHRTDTYAPTVSVDGRRVLFSAVTNRSGTNPKENCQLFSVDRSGGDLRQLSDFAEDAPRSENGCFSGRPPFGCNVFYTDRDAHTDAIIFSSTCDPFGTNPFGS